MLSKYKAHRGIIMFHGSEPRNVTVIEKWDRENYLEL